MLRRFNMKKMVLLVLFLSLLLGVGCTKAVRYSEDEIKAFSPEMQENIRKGQVGIGMSPQEVRYAWGSPDSIRILEPFDGKQLEEWIYSTLPVYGTRLLLFYDNKLMYIRGSF
jgi:outer membrane protein assembly factor BamE (lipoprotein component of BamABCDE complex)